MLDQNTDRMWFVIGALVVGAGIILLANKAMPEIFASVAETFSEQTEQSTEVVESIVPRVNLLSEYQHLTIRGGELLRKDGTMSSGKDSEFLRYADLAPIFERFDTDQTYTLSFEVKSLDTTNQQTMLAYMQTGRGSKYRFIYQYVPVSEEEFTKYEFTGLKARLDENSTYDTAHLAFFGGMTNDDYGNGNVPVVRNVKLYAE